MHLTAQGRHIAHADVQLLRGHVPLDAPIVMISLGWLQMVLFGAAMIVPVTSLLVSFVWTRDRWRATRFPTPQSTPMVDYRDTPAIPSDTRTLTLIWISLLPSGAAVMVVQSYLILQLLARFAVEDVLFFIVYYSVMIGALAAHIDYLARCGCQQQVERNLRSIYAGVALIASVSSLFGKKVSGVALLVAVAPVVLAFMGRRGNVAAEQQADQIANIAS